MIKESFNRLYPGKDFAFDARLAFSNRFKPYNANIRKKGSVLEINLSRKWKTVDKEIVIGLIQELLYKILKEANRKPTVNIDLYNNFVKNLHLATTRPKSNTILETAFKRVNDKYFLGMVEQPNLVFGHDSKRTLASYDFHTDTVTVSSLFREHEDIIDYLMYHELLHKRLQFENKKGRNHHHTPEFRRKEKAFENHDVIEKKINVILRGRKRSFKYPFFIPI